MKQFAAFTKKEILEQLRTGRLLVLALIFCIFGVMNPAIAKITPWMMEMMAEQFAESGMSITVVDVDALTSWTQFFKNMPMALIIFLILFSGAFITEYQKGTLINIVTKGMKRWKVFISKMSVMLVIWTLGCLICYGITFIYNDYFWDNNVARNIFFAAFCFYLFGLWMISILGLASVFCNSQGGVLLVAGAAFGASYLLGLFPIMKEYLPSYLLQSADLLVGKHGLEDYFPSIVVLLLLILLQSILSLAVFNKKEPRSFT